MKCPECCPICGAEWIGGHCEPKEEMKVGLRVWYECGMSMSIKDDGWPERRGNLFVLMKNCEKLIH